MEKEKYHNLDGLRGLAALVVMIWHFSVGFLPFLVGATIVGRHTPIDRLVSDTPLFLPFAGTFAVYIFFVLSGFVLSLSFFHKRDSSVLVSSAARRYFRLMIPAASSVILAYLLMRLIGNDAHLAASKTTGSYWLSAFWDFKPHLLTAIYQGVYGVFFTNFNSYNTNLWTMQNELFGSFMVFLFLGLFGKLARRWVFYLAFGLILLKTPYLAFLLGMAICDVWVNRPDLKQLLTARVSTILLVAGLLLGSWHVGWLNLYNPVYGRFTLPMFNQAEMQVFVLIIAAACLILAVLRLGWLKRFFELRPLQYLGKVSSMVFQRVSLTDL
jgi:peptidoglycan/LPS O-acetylase OafA/YrhL